MKTIELIELGTLEFIITYQDSILPETNDWISLDDKLNFRVVSRVFDMKNHRVIIYGEKETLY